MASHARIMPIQAEGARAAVARRAAAANHISHQSASWTKTLRGQMGTVKRIRKSGTNSQIIGTSDGISVRRVREEIVRARLLLVRQTQTLRAARMRQCPPHTLWRRVAPSP